MQEKAGQFRSAAFGGFHRQDVLHYIEQLTREHQANCERLERELTEERTARQQAEERLRQAEAQAAEAEKAQADLENTLAATQAELEKTTTALTQAKATAASLEEKLQDIEPEAASWQRIKDTAGGIEVAAHERAQVTLQTARAQAAEIAHRYEERAGQAAEIRAEGTRWVWDIQSRCQQLQRDLHDAIVSAETELDEVRTAFHRAQAHMEGVQDALSHLVSGTEETEKNHKG